MKKKLLLLTLSASSLLYAQPALANDAKTDVEAKLSSNQWKGLKAAKNGGANIAYVDKASLSAEEKAAIRALGKDERVKECSVYKLVYEKNGAPVNKPKTLPNTGDVVGYGYLVGAGVLAGLAFYLLRNKQGRKMLVIMLVGGSSLVYAINDTNAFSGNPVAPTILVASNNVINAPEIDGYRFVGVIELEGVCLIDPNPTPKPEPKPDPKPEPKPEPDPKVTPEPNPEEPQVKPGTPSPACPPTMNPNLPSEVPTGDPGTPSPACPPTVVPNLPTPPSSPGSEVGTPAPASSPIMAPFMLDFSDEFEDVQKDELKRTAGLF